MMSDQKRQQPPNFLLSLAVFLAGWQQAASFYVGSSTAAGTNRLRLGRNGVEGAMCIQPRQRLLLGLSTTSISTASSTSTWLMEETIAAVLPAPPQAQPTKRRKSTKKVMRNPEMFTGRSMWRHELLTKQEELALGRQLQRAMRYQAKLLEYYHLYLQQPQTTSSSNKPSRRKGSSTKKVRKVKKDDLSDDLFQPRDRRSAENEGEYYWGTNDHDDDYSYSLGRKRNAVPFDSEQQDEDLIYLSIYGGGRLQDLEEEQGSWKGEEKWATPASPSRKLKRKKVSSPTASKKRNEKDWNRKISMAILKRIPDQVLHHEWDTTRDEIEECLALGAMARETLIRSNVRLVVNLAKQWANQQHKGSSNGNLYQASWDRPSLDEAVQEGILGLAKAADRFEPQRNLRFSTYATLWVTSQIRKCFQKASTPGLTVPSALLDQKSRFKKLLKSYHDAGVPVPPVQELAREMGVTLKKLEWILLKTRPAASTDQPANGGGGQSTTWAGKAGNTEPNDPSNVLGVNMVDPVDAGRSPYHAIEWNWMRQALENAMASQLVPYERDILRLRLGLDDGVSRTVPQVVQAMSSSSNNNYQFTASQVRSAESRAYRKLRSPHCVSTYQLNAYLDICGIDKADCTKTKGLRL